MAEYCRQPTAMAWMVALHSQQRSVTVSSAWAILVVKIGHKAGAEIIGPKRKRVICCSKFVVLFVANRNKYGSFVKNHFSGMK